MIEVIEQQLRPDMSHEEKYNRLREFIQILTLKLIYDKDYFNNFAFTGGTALRILHGMRRFSEDLDFSLFNAEGYDFSRLTQGLIKALKADLKKKKPSIVPF